ncbi:MAG: hypothetical protein KUG65_11000 [Sphingomonadaceae bacterium]|nr:hypothetical protein [Sphingomonadaceae bacterium]
MPNQRGLSGPVQAMARPAWAADQLAIVREAMGSFPDDMSRRSRARILASRVVAEILASDRCVDPMEIALAEARFALAREAAVMLARDLASELARERLRRFEARGCQQLAPDAWTAETREIGDELEGRLFEKFRKV